MSTFRISSTIVLALLTSLSAAQIRFDTPSDDRWFYPFNFNPCARTVGSCFGAAGLNGFNDRDGTFLAVWDTSELVPPGQGAENYDISALRVTVTNIADADWAVDLTPDEWYTFDINQDGFINADGIPRGEQGDTDGESSDADAGRPLELFGVAFGPQSDYATWSECSDYHGSDSQNNLPRDPFPFVYQEATNDLLHCEDNVKGLHNDGLSIPVFEFTPVSWTVGVPVGYTPGEQTVPFDITFDINLSRSDARVLRYFQEQLNGGRVFIYINSLADTSMGGGQSEFPTLYMKESTEQGAAPARLELSFNEPIPCEDVKKLTARCRDGTLKSKVVLTDETHDGQPVTIEVNGAPYDLTISGRRASLKLRNQTGSQTACLSQPDCGLCKTVDCGA